MKRRGFLTAILGCAVAPFIPPVAAAKAKEIVPGLAAAICGGWISSGVGFLHGSAIGGSMFVSRKITSETVCCDLRDPRCK